MPSKDDESGYSGAESIDAALDNLIQLDRLELNGSGDDLRASRSTRLKRDQRRNRNQSASPPPPLRSLSPSTTEMQKLRRRFFPVTSNANSALEVTQMKTRRTPSPQRTHHHHPNNNYDHDRIHQIIEGDSAHEYASKLSALRRERLLLEEQRLLELTRQQELERIRGPKAKWYEMKGPQQHYENRKNTAMLKSSDYWQDLLDYREILEANDQA